MNPRPQSRRNARRCRLLAPMYIDGRRQIKGGEEMRDERKTKEELQLICQTVARVEGEALLFVRFYWFHNWERWFSKVVLISHG